MCDREAFVFSHELLWELLWDILCVRFGGVRDAEALTWLVGVLSDTVIDRELAWEAEGVGGERERDTLSSKLRDTLGVAGSAERVVLRVCFRLLVVGWSDNDPESVRFGFDCVGVGERNDLVFASVSDSDTLCEPLPVGLSDMLTS